MICLLCVNKLKYFVISLWVIFVRSEKTIVLRHASLQSTNTLACDRLKVTSDQLIRVCVVVKT